MFNGARFRILGAAWYVVEAQGLSGSPSVGANVRNSINKRKKGRKTRDGKWKMARERWRKNFINVSF